MPWGTEGFGVVSTLSRSRLAAPLGPARYVGMVRAVPVTACQPLLVSRPRLSVAQVVARSSMNWAR